MSPEKGIDQKNVCSSGLSADSPKSLSEACGVNQLPRRPACRGGSRAGALREQDERRLLILIESGNHFVLCVVPAEPGIECLQQVGVAGTRGEIELRRQPLRDGVFVPERLHDKRSLGRTEEPARQGVVSLDGGGPGIALSVWVAEPQEVSIVREMRVVFRSAKDRPFAERKATIGQLILERSLRRTGSPCPGWPRWPLWATCVTKEQEVTTEVARDQTSCAKAHR